MSMIGISGKGFDDMLKAVLQTVAGETSSEERDNNIIDILKDEEVHERDRIRVVRDLDSEDETLINEEGIVVGIDKLTNLYCVELFCGETIICELQEIVKVRR